MGDGSWLEGDIEKGSRAHTGSTAISIQKRAETGISERFTLELINIRQTGKTLE